MKVYTTKESLHSALASSDNPTSIGFVPTMGALHEGHLSLVKQAFNDNQQVVVSIFVNPTQFDNPSDLEKYPRNLDHDIRLLSTVSKDILVFAPSATHLYNNQIVGTSYNFGGIENEMEGKHRSGHFDGVGTVLNLLFKAVSPTKAYFGEKDFQQLQIVRKLVEIEKLNVEIIGCPIVREPNGLAMSSRNKRLSEKQREDASFIYQMLVEASQQFSSKSIPQITAFVTAQFKAHSTLRLEYFDIANEQTLKIAKRKRRKNRYRAFIAAYAAEVRLIDNKRLN